MRNGWLRLTSNPLCHSTVRLDWAGPYHPIFGRERIHGRVTRKVSLRGRVSVCKTSQRISGGYPEIGALAYGRTGRWIVLIFYNLVLLGVATLYIILASLNMSLLVGTLNQTQWMIVCTILSSIPFLLFPTLKEVAVISFFGSIASFLVVIAVGWVGLVDDLPTPLAAHDWIHPVSLASAMATFTFSFGGNFVYPEVERSMARPEEFPRVLSTSMKCITFLYLLMGGIGYYVYGNDTQSPILLNMSSGYLTTLSILLVTFHVILACPIILTTFAIGLERNWDSNDLLPVSTEPLPPYDESRESTATATTTPLIAHPKQSWNHFIKVKTFRLFISVLVCLIAISVPFFSDLMGLLGAVANTLLVFIFPVLFYAKCYPEAVKDPFTLLVLAVIFIIGTLAGSIGGYEATLALLSHYQS